MTQDASGHSCKGYFKGNALTTGVKSLKRKIPRTGHTLTKTQPNNTVAYMTLPLNRIDTCSDNSEQMKQQRKAK